MSTPAGILNLQALAEIRRKVADSASRAGRSPEEITIIAVTKAFPVEAMITAVGGGLNVLGESRIQETIDKLPHFRERDQVELHLIGHLQKNKARKAVEIYDVIETVDSIRLARRIDTIAAEMGTPQSIYLQVNSGNDPAKFGLSVSETIDFAGQIVELPSVIIKGLMVIAPYTKDDFILRDTFSRTRELRDRLQQAGIESCRDLSMGMSGDFELAVEEGATHVRIGTALFGQRRS